MFSKRISLSLLLLLIIVRPVSGAGGQPAAPTQQLESAEQQPISPNQLQLDLQKMRQKLGYDTERRPDDASSSPDEYTILCSSEKRTGLNWVNGDWEPVQYKNTQRLIVKSKSNDCGGLTGGDSSNEAARVYIKGVCINEREIGKEYISEKSFYCAEVYQDGNFYILCNKILHMGLSFNGWYHYAHINIDLSDSKDSQYRKGSQYVEVGKCSMIKP